MSLLDATLAAALKDGIHMLAAIEQLDVTQQLIGQLRVSGGEDVLRLLAEPIDVAGPAHASLHRLMMHQAVVLQ
ncbi:hypothetical protein [Candidatus Amarolinea dominans]|uniref:hypothetical protein n=1 Tax=Candidatus Amarolinea dominans TaxID=3140696 RepID=UPI0031CC5B42